MIKSTQELIIWFIDFSITKTHYDILNTYFRPLLKVFDKKRFKID